MRDGVGRIWRKLQASRFEPQFDQGTECSQTDSLGYVIEKQNPKMPSQRNCRPRSQPLDYPRKATDATCKRAHIHGSPSRNRSRRHYPTLSVSKRFASARPKLRRTQKLSAWVILRITVEANLRSYLGRRNGVPLPQISQHPPCPPTCTWLQKPFRRL